MEKEVYFLSRSDDPTIKLAAIQQVFGSGSVINTNQPVADLIEEIQSCFSSQTVFITDEGPEVVALVSALIAETNETEQGIVTLYSELYFFYEFDHGTLIQKIYPYS